jgi:hypothetical protein
VLFEELLSLFELVLDILVPPYGLALFDDLGLLVDGLLGEFLDAALLLVEAPKPKVS